MRFIGIDFGWRSQPSGMCCLQWQDEVLQIIAIERCDNPDEVIEWVNCYAPHPQPALIAIDAPIVIPNQTGMRLVDKLTHVHFGRYHAGCYPANLQLPFAQRVVQFSQNLEGLEFQHAATITPQRLGRYQIEVFPHPASIRLFGLQKILKYKKGRLAERQSELKRFYHLLTSELVKQQPALATVESVPSIAEQQLTGHQLKNIEDQLDALLCAYVGAHWWYWGVEKNQILGDQAGGYLIVPLEKV